jgi:hypothetical protein
MMRKFFRRCPIPLLLAPILSCALGASKADVTTLKSRTFDFTYAASIKGLSPDGPARIWLPIPPSNAQQKVRILDQTLPTDPETTFDQATGNHYLYLRAPASAEGTITLSITYRVTRHETGEMPTTQPAKADDQYLKADALVPVDGKPISLLDQTTLSSDQMQLGRQLYDWVDDHMQYRKDRPGWGRGDAVWACNSGFGNCTDFHSLFISLARSEKLPARFVMGFSIPEEHGAGNIAGYHCWAMFKPRSHGWIPVDIAAASQHPEKRDYYFGHLCENRVAFSAGRDLVLIPKQEGPPLNFFIYPYVEVAGKAISTEQITARFSYADVSGP